MISKQKIITPFAALVLFLHVGVIIASPTRVEVAFELEVNISSQKVGDYWPSRVGSQFVDAQNDCEDGDEYDLTLVDNQAELELIGKELDLGLEVSFWLDAKFNPRTRCFVWQRTGEPVGEWITRSWAGTYEPNKYTSQFALMLHNDYGVLKFSAQPTTYTTRYLCERRIKCGC